MSDGPTLGLVTMGSSNQPLPLPRWSRMPLLTSASEFSLPMGGSAPPSPSPLGTSSSGDEVNPFGLVGVRKMRRPSFKGSALVAAANISTGVHRSRSDSIERHRQWGHHRSQSTSSMADHSTPPTDMFALEPATTRISRPNTPSTPPRRRASVSGTQQRRASANLKLQPRLQHLRTDASINLVEQELKMEAHFQRLLSNVETAESALPAVCSPRPMKPNRGRFPEEVVQDDEPTQENDDSSDEGEPSGSASVSMSLFQEDRAMSEDGSTMMRASPAISLMDLDQPTMFYGAYSNSSGSGTGTPRDAWRQTPPPTSNGSRVNKRKFASDERYEPYAYPAAKRRAVSPAVTGMPSPLVIPRSPIIRPMTQSVLSSPVFAKPAPAAINMPMSLTSSPIMRPASLSVHMSSPIMRPIVRLRASAAHGGNGPEHAVDGAGSGVGGLTLT
ncbi:hypothetical protein BKA62DRAFT_765625 [Auriculariales sp. MPI-PUGE-AT-0066]|nr:hypothetical protein BKA62DRAFT_765625 [Auriculariales sp. MPI-PUGE-AT-0066]